MFVAAFAGGCFYFSFLVLIILNNTGCFRVCGVIVSCYDWFDLL